MRAVHSVKEVQETLKEFRDGKTGSDPIFAQEASGKMGSDPVFPSLNSIGLVPTMGALHTGHIRLIQTARQECGFVAVSIFVNPLQFGPNEDYARYPKTLEADLEICRQNGVDLVFAPSVEEMYPLPNTPLVDVPAGLTEHLCGPFRPGHFQGVATVVLKLFDIVKPNRAYFGEKDAQQLAVIRRVVRDRNLLVEIVGVPTVREPDGLALSSRNKYLSHQERQIAPFLYKSLKEAARLIRSGDKDPAQVRKSALRLLDEDLGISVEYFEIVEPEGLQPVTTIEGPVLIAAAVWIGTTRLIDNVSA